jgi:hypothetical protein
MKRRGSMSVIHNGLEKSDILRQGNDNTTLCLDYVDDEKGGNNF